MKPCVFIDTKDAVLRQRITLALRGVCLITDSEGAEITIADTVSPETEGRRIVIRRSGQAPSVLGIPFSITALISAVSEGGRERELLTLSDMRDYATLGEKKIKLTDGEGRLLSALMSGGGKFVSREELIKDTWGDVDGGLLNVYIHYLREKLEAGGMRVILSSRKQGYKIDEKFLGGTNE